MNSLNAWVDLVKAAALLVACILCVTSLLLRLRTTRFPLLHSANSQAHEHEPLISSENLVDDDVVRDVLLPSSQTVRSLSIINCVISVLFLAIAVFSSSLPSVSLNEHSLASSIMNLMTWIVVTAFLFVFASKQVVAALRLTSLSTPPELVLFLRFALVSNFVGIAQWTVLIAHHQTVIWKNSLDVASFIALVFSVLITAILNYFAGPLWKKSDLGNAQTLNNSTSSNGQTWADTLRKCKRLIPFLWPRGIYLQSLVVACFLLIGAGRVVNLGVPYTYKLLIDGLTANESIGTPVFTWSTILLYTFFRFMQGGVGLVSCLQNLLWIPVSQYTTREISLKMLEHLHSLSIRFHINRKTGELLRVMDRGVSSIGSLLNYIAFNIAPVFIDIGVAVVYFSIAFDAAIAAIVFSTMALYIFFTIWITEWRTGFRREMNDLDSASRARAVDSLLNFETVKYFGNESWELEQYSKAIIAFQNADWKSSASLNLLNSAQNIVITLGLFSGVSVTAKKVVDGQLTTGDFVSFVTYLLQLYQPLNWFGTYYRMIQSSFIDMEKMLDLFDEEQDVRDVAGAETLIVNSYSAKVVFSNVSFSYDASSKKDNSVNQQQQQKAEPSNGMQTASQVVEASTIKNISFTVEPGTTTALVGTSGGGKSTVLKLLFRLYDIDSGSISINGQDIRLVTQSSLRKSMGVVPQDTVLFNDTVESNIRYGDVNANSAQVEVAAKAAQIHQRILEFPQGYQTIVGERGLRLSGGERQRIAIARTILKNPSIILLDEATSALDNRTELKLQQELKQVCKNRTTLVVAHRLSTIVDADQILVFSEGRICERGVHDDLLKIKGGVYRNLWMRESEQQQENSS